MNAPAHVRVFYPADPVGVVPGGIDTFLRGMIKWAPPELEFSLVGMTTDRQARPVDRWTECDLGRRSYRSLPIISMANAGSRGRIPLSVRYMAAMRSRMQVLSAGFDVADFHRPEPSFLLARDHRPKNAYYHQDPKFVQLTASDNLWKHMPGIYERMEGRSARRFDSLWCVRESGVMTLRERYPDIASRVRFIPTWVDTEVFHPLGPEARAVQREAVAQEIQASPQSTWIVTVGRLDTQKNPQLMLEAFARLREAGQEATWIAVGDGVLRSALEQEAQRRNLTPHIRFVGLKSPEQIARILQVSDLYALSSAYEGMPMALLEAMGCGLPAVVTDVGEVRRVVQPDVNGVIAAEQTVEAFTVSLLRGVRALSQWRGSPATKAIEPFQPATVLASAYENYLKLAHQPRLLRSGAQERLAAAGIQPQRARVIGVPIDLLSRPAVSQLLVAWGRKRESRYACFCNVHSAVMASRDPRHKLVMEGADLVCPDGAPIAWRLRRSGYNQERVDGPGMMWRLCADARDAGVSIGLYGSTPTTLGLLVQELTTAFPGLRIDYVHSPPFRTLSAEEDEKVCQDIRDSGVGLLFVGLGCPKQELWMAEHRGRVPAVMLGVGAAFEFHAGTVSRAPHWMRENGLEWLHRLSAQPGKLWRRYLFTNSIFVAKVAGDAARHVIVRTTDPLRRRRDRVRRFVPQTLAHVMSAPLDSKAIDALVTRIDGELPPRGTRIIEFVASGQGEGTSTLANAYAVANAKLARRVLLLGADERDAAGVLQAIAQGEELDRVITQRRDGVYVGTIGAAGAAQASDALARAEGALANESVWGALRGSFDLIVLDMPAATVSRLGVRMAPSCDAVVVVVEAERTRAPVVRSLLAELSAAHANVLGTVFNKRQYHLPARLYRLL